LTIDPATKAVTYSLGLGVAVDPSAFPSVLVGGSMINGQLNVSSDGEKRCLLFGFDGGESGGVSIAGGAMVAHQFRIAVNSLSTPCSAEVNGSPVSVPANAKGLSFNSTIGDASFAISLAKSSTGYTGSVDVGNVTLAGIQYTALNLSVSSNGSASSESFSASMKTNLGNFSVSSGLSKASGATTQSLSASGTDLNIGSRKFKLNQLGFSGTFTVPASGCPTKSFNANASGTAMGNQSYTVTNFGLSLTCNTITSFNFNASFTHYVSGGSNSDGGASKTYSLAIAYQATSNDNASFSLSAGLSYRHGFNYKKGAYKMARTVTFSGNIGFVLTTTNAWASISEGSVSGRICADADRVSGCANVSFATDGSFTFGLDLRVNPSFAGIWHWNWTV
jgi:hypothetical protein